MTNICNILIKTNGNKQMNDYEELKKLVRNLLSAIDTEMDLGGYHIDDAFADDEKIEEYQQAVDEVVSLRERIGEIIK